MLELICYGSPASASSQDFFGLQLVEFALTFHFSVSGFAHDFTSFFFSLAFLVIAFLLLPEARFLSAISPPKISIFSQVVLLQRHGETRQN